jgi:hypothetical protein
LIGIVLIAVLWAATFGGRRYGLRTGVTVAALLLVGFGLVWASANPMGLLWRNGGRPFTFDAYWEYQEWIAAGLLAAVAVIGGALLDIAIRTGRRSRVARSADKLAMRP